MKHLSIFLFFLSTWLNHISFKASREPWAQAAPGCKCGLESEQISSLREWNLLFTRHGPHPQSSLSGIFPVTDFGVKLTALSQQLPPKDRHRFDIPLSKSGESCASKGVPYGQLSVFANSHFQHHFLLLLFSLFRRCYSCGACSNSLTIEGSPGVSATQSIIGGYDLNLESTGRECVKVHFSYSICLYIPWCGTLLSHSPLGLLMTDSFTNLWKSFGLQSIFHPLFVHWFNTQSTDYVLGTMPMCRHVAINKNNSVFLQFLNK